MTEKFKGYVSPQKHEQQEDIELAEKRVAVRSLVEETRDILSSPDWSVEHSTEHLLWGKGIQTKIFFRRVRVGERFEAIHWRMLFRGHPVWEWKKDGWNIIRPGKDDFETLFGDKEKFVEVVRAAEVKAGRGEPDRVDVHPLVEENGATPFNLPELKRVSVNAFKEGRHINYQLSPMAEILVSDESPRRNPNSGEPHTKYDGVL